METEKKSKCIKGLIKLIVFLLILCICLNVIYNITRRKDFITRKADFFSQKQDFDVLFYGTSHIRNSILPMELWKNYGIISYNLGNASERMVATYYNILLSLKYTNPKLIVIDTLSTAWSKKVVAAEEKRNHATFNPYPMSFTKLLAIMDIYSKEELLDKSFEYMFDFSLYHDRWDELTKEDFLPEIDTQKGAKFLVRVEKPNQMSDFDSIEISNRNETINMKYLRKIIELCNERNIEVLLVNMPYPASDYRIASSKYVEKVADEYDIEYINFLNMDIVNYDIDCSDADSHLNLSGARKVTNYIGEYITKRYNIKDERNNEVFDFWNEDYNEYIDFKIKCFKDNEKNLNNYLMLLYGESDIRYEIKISSKKEIKEGTTLYHLLNNLNNNYEIDDDVFKEKKNKSVKITTWDSRDNKIINTVWW